MKVERKEKETARDPSVGPDAEQSPTISNTNILPENKGTEGKTFPGGKDLNDISDVGVFSVHNKEQPAILNFNRICDGALHRDGI